MASESRECHRISQCYRWHEEGYRDGVESEYGAELNVAGVSIAVMPCQTHEQSCREMAKPEEPLGLNKLVGQDSHNSGHENRYYPLHGVEEGYFTSQTVGSEIVADTSEICAPDGELEEVHYCELGFDRSSLIHGEIGVLRWQI